MLNKQISRVTLAFILATALSGSWQVAILAQAPAPSDVTKVKDVKFDVSVSEHEFRAKVK